MAMKIEVLVTKVGAELVRSGSRTTIEGLAMLEEATAGQLSFYLNKTHRDRLKGTAASAVLADRKLLQDAQRLLPQSCALLVHNQGMHAFIEVLNLFSHLFPTPAAAAQSQAYIAAGVRLGKNVSYGAVSIATGCIIGDNVTLADGVRLGEGVEIGKDSIIYPNVVLYPRTCLGERVIIHGNSVIGAEGYGYVSQGGTHRKIPHIGRVVIEDDVEIGANCCVDRATLGTTRIGKGSKMDNQVHVGHNVDIGEGVLLCGQAAIGGSTTIGDGTILAGKAGAIDHIKLGKRNRVYVGSIVCNETPDDAHLLGQPARAKRDVMRENVLIRKLPQMFKILNRLDMQHKDKREKTKNKAVK